MLTNEAPDLRDASGALASRFIVVAMRASFLGKEDLTLEDDLKAELPAILRWSLDGLDRLRLRGRFIQPTSANDEVELLSALTAPVQQFVNQECERGDAYEVPVDVLYRAWVAWRVKEGHDYTGPSPAFGRQLKAAVKVQIVRPSAPEAGPARQRRYRGLRLIKRDRTGSPDLLVS
jgi:putative DNA primase/helicase